jgi:hypothetical protein
MVIAPLLLGTTHDKGRRAWEYPPYSGLLATTIMRRESTP